MDQVFDVVVLGGGPAGLAAAIAVSKEGYSVAVIERTSYDDVRAGEHVPPEISRHVFQLGAAEILQNPANLASPGILSFWGGREPISKNYIVSPYGEGSNLARPLFDALLAKHAKECGVCVLQGARSRLLNDETRWRFEIAESVRRRSINARFVVDATGRSAWLLRAMKIEIAVFDKTIALISYVPACAISSTGGAQLVVEATNDGWWYTAPLASGMAVIAFVTDADLLSRDPDGLQKVWQKQLAKTRYTRAQFLKNDVELTVYVRPAHSQMPKRIFGKNWLAVGDAAGSFDPLSGQGILKAISGGIQTARAISHCLNDQYAYVLKMQQDINEQFSAYMHYRQHIYNSSRFHNSVFWRRRAV